MNARGANIREQADRARIGLCTCGSNDSQHLVGCAVYFHRCDRVHIDSLASAVERFIKTPEDVDYLRRAIDAVYVMREQFGPVDEVEVENDIDAFILHLAT